MQSQSSWRAGCQRKIDDRVARSVVRETSIRRRIMKESVILLRSDISRLSRGTTFSESHSQLVSASLATQRVGRIVTPSEENEFSLEDSQTFGCGFLSKNGRGGVAPIRDISAEM
jgi:hypothetical protein